MQIEHFRKEFFIRFGDFIGLTCSGKLFLLQKNKNHKGKLV